LQEIQTSVAVRAATAKADRRVEIAKALYECMCRRGYANTTLKDIAEEAAMSPSHLGYYFDGQAAILEYYMVGLAERIVADFPDLGEPDLARLSDTIARFCFGDGQLNTEFLGVIEELTGLAVHDARLHEIKSQHARAWREYLEAFFGRLAPLPGLMPRDAARLAHALLVGLQTNMIFERALSREAAHGLFRRTLRALGGLDLGDSAEPAAALSRGARRPLNIKARKRTGTTGRQERSR
jgi:AcrR family transcriptional regulator